MKKAQERSPCGNLWSKDSKFGDGIVLVAKWILFVSVVLTVLSMFFELEKLFPKGEEERVEETASPVILLEEVKS